MQVRPVALSDLVESMLPRLRQLFGRHIEIIPDLTHDMASVIADPVQVRQIVLKLAVNSLEAMEQGGTFCLQTANATAMEPGLGSMEISGGPYGMLAVSDSGPGLDDQSWAHLYEAFFSTKANGSANRRSLGLGLAAVYGIVRQSGGRLWTYSRPGKGATFRIYLPLAGTHLPALPEPQTDRHHSLVQVPRRNARGYGESAEKARLPRAGGSAPRRGFAGNGDARTAGPGDLSARARPDRASGAHPAAITSVYLGGYADGLIAQDQGLPPGTSLLQKPFEPETLLAAVRGLLFQPL